MNQNISEPHHTLKLFCQFRRNNASPEKDVETFLTFLREPELLLLYQMVGQIKNLLSSALKVYGYCVLFHEVFLEKHARGLLVVDADLLDAPFDALLLVQNNVVHTL